MLIADWKNIKVGDHVWHADYDYASGGKKTKCTRNEEPTEYIIDSCDGTHAGYGKKVNGKSKYTTYLRAHCLYHTKEEAVEYYQKQLASHARSLISIVSEVTSVMALRNRLRKFGLNNVNVELEKINKIAIQTHSNLC